MALAHLKVSTSLTAAQRNPTPCTHHAVGPSRNPVLCLAGPIPHPEYGVAPTWVGQGRSESRQLSKHSTIRQQISKACCLRSQVQTGIQVLTTPEAPADPRVSPCCHEICEVHTKECPAKGPQMSCSGQHVGKGNSSWGRDLVHIVVTMQMFPRTYGTHLPPCPLRPRARCQLGMGRC